MWGRGLGRCQGGTILDPPVALTTLWSCGGAGLGEGTVSLPGFWRFAWHSPCFQLLHPLPVVHLLAVSLVMNPRVGAYVLSPCGPFRPSILEIWQFLLLPQIPLVFTTRSYGDLFYCCWRPGLCSLSWGCDCSLPRFPSLFVSAICECGIIHSATASLHHAMSPRLSACLRVSACPTGLNECGLFKSLVIGLQYSLIF